MALTDLLSVALRGLSFIAMAQAAGAVLFTLLFRQWLLVAHAPILRHARWWTAAGLLLVPAQYLMEAGRMAGQFGGVLDLQLQRLVLEGPTAIAAGTRVAALVLLGIALHEDGMRGWARAVAWAGMVVMAVSFALVGHTSNAPDRLLLGPLLILHLGIVSFWFGALRPLVLVARLEEPGIAAQIVVGFSRTAALVVPALLVTGAIVTVRLLPDLDALAGSYGIGILAKIGAFAMLMVLAILNKWRLGPALASGQAAAKRSFIRIVQAEWLVIATVLMGTAALTTLTSPH